MGKSARMKSNRSRNFFIRIWSKPSSGVGVVGEARSEGQRGRCCCCGRRKGFAEGLSPGMTEERLSLTFQVL